jgi:hypothetical protein
MNYENPNFYETFYVHNMSFGCLSFEINERENPEFAQTW